MEQAELCLISREIVGYDAIPVLTIDAVFRLFLSYVILGLGVGLHPREL